MEFSRRSFMQAGAAILLGEFTIHCGGEAHHSEETLDRYLERAGAAFDERIVEGKSGRVVVGWRGNSLHFPRAREKLRDGDRIFFILVDGRDPGRFLEDVDARGVRRVDLRVYRYDARKNARHGEP
jgi:hypothetical protein